MRDAPARIDSEPLKNELMSLKEEFAQKVNDAIARPWWKPADGTLVALLAETSAEQSRGYVRWGMWAAVLSYLGYGFLDRALLPDVSTQTIAARAVVGVTFLALIELCIWRQVSQKVLHLVAASAIVAGALGWLIAAIGTTHQYALSHFMVFGTVFVLGSNLFFNFRFWLSAASSSLITLVFTGSSLFFLQASIEARIVLAVFFVNCLVLSLYLSWRLGSERYHTFLHSLQARIQEQVAIEQGQKFQEIANTDHLTGLKNRRAISRDFLSIRHSWSMNGRQIGVILIDVDFFKRYNDRFGHQSGDDCLISIAKSISETADRNEAFAGRHGGEEFVVLCKAENAQHLSDIAVQFCRSVEALQIDHPDRDDGRDIITISAGASLSQAGASAELSSLLQEADRALYSSKFAGRATVTVFDPEVADRDRSSHNLSQLLKDARDKQLLSTVYQPIKDAKSGAVLAYETLLRLHDFDGSSISPNVFIPEAERTGAIVELGKWVIERACDDLQALEPDVTISVNVSGVQVKAPGFALQVAEIIGRRGIAPRRLAVELTEGIDIFLEEQALRNIEELRKLGVQIWLDDFGTGFAGLAWLRQFEFDVVKIDRGFLHDCQTEDGILMLRDMISLLHNRGVCVLVEGIETEEQERLLMGMPVDLLQGFRIGMPESIEKLAQEPPLAQSGQNW